MAGTEWSSSKGVLSIPLRDTPGGLSGDYIKAKGEGQKQGTTITGAPREARGV
jgi:hypothetical protein